MKGEFLMIDFGSRGILNGLSQEEIFDLVRETMDEVGIEYQYAPGGVVFYGLKHDDLFGGMFISFDTIQSSRNIAYRNQTEMERVSRNGDLEQNIKLYRQFSKQSLFAA